MSEVPADVLARYSRFPDQVTASGPAEEFLRLACLSYSDDDDPARWAQARQILVANPQIVQGSVNVAAAVADAQALRRTLASDPAAASRRRASASECGCLGCLTGPSSPSPKTPVSTVNGVAWLCQR